MVSPSGVQSADEKSIASRTTVECAVRKIVNAISSAIDPRALATIWRVTASASLSRTSLSRAARGAARLATGALPFDDEGLAGRVAAHGPAGRDDDGGVVLVDEERAA